MKLPVTQPWYAQGLKFTCQQCGNCCTGGPGFVYFSRDEIQRLAAHLQLSESETLEKYCRKVGSQISLKEVHNAQGQLDCIFLKEIKPAPVPGKVTHTLRVCGIYAVRPLQCRTWPFWEGNLASQEAWDEAAKHCHGMNRGKSWSADKMEGLRDATDWPGETPTSKPRKS